MSAIGAKRTFPSDVAQQEAYLLDLRREGSAIHGLCDANTEAALKAAGAGLVTTNSVSNPWAQIDVAPLIAKAVAEFLNPSS